MLKALSLIIAAIAFVALGYYINNNKNIDVTEKVAIAEDDEDVATKNTKEEPKIQTKAATISPNKAEIDLEHVAKPRIVGNPDAPVRIDEIVSLSCPHCANFYKNVYGDVIKNFVDTGKVYIVYHDFPLNRQALEAAAIARCLPEKQFHKFISLLFQTQEKWKHDKKYPKMLYQNAKLAGLSGEMIEKCVNSKEIHEIITKDIDYYIKTFNIKSTPSLVINNKEVLGYTPYEKLEKILNSYYEESVK